MSDREISAIHVDGGLYNLKDAVARAQQTTFKIFDAEPFKADLSVVKLSVEDYEQLVSGGNAVSNVLYIVEGEDEDMYGQRVTNVGWPTDLSDAATKLYVDSAVSAAAISVDATLSVQGAAADAKAVGDALRGGFTEWEFSDGEAHTIAGPMLGSDDNWHYMLDSDHYSTNEFASESDAANALSLSFEDTSVTANRHLITPTKTSQLSNDSGFLSAVPDAYALKSDVKMSYYSAARKIVLSAGSNQTSVDCNDFIKDGMLSSVELCAGQLVFRFNTDSGTTPISVALSDFIDETQYWKKSETSSASQIEAALSGKSSVIFVDWED